jgi:hypothetical protein
MKRELDTLKCKLGDFQSDIDEIVGKDEMREGAYVRLSKKIKTAYDSLERVDVEKVIRETRIETIAEMCVVSPLNISVRVEGIFPLDSELIKRVLTKAEPSVKEDWYNDLSSAFIEFCFSWILWKTSKDRIWLFIDLMKELPTKMQMPMADSIVKFWSGERLANDCIAKKTSITTNRLRSLVKAFPLVVTLWKEIPHVAILKRLNMIKREARNAASKDHPELWSILKFTDVVGHKTEEHESSSEEESNYGDEDEDDEDDDDDDDDE